MCERDVVLGWALSTTTIADAGQSWQSSYLYRYSGRLSWSPSLNQYSEAIRARQASGNPLFDLTISNPTSVGLAYPHAAITKAYASIANFSYNPEPLGLPSAREAIRDYYLSHDVRVSPANIALTASTSEAYGLLLKLLCDPHDEVLVPTPSYPLFEYLAAAESVRTKPYFLRYDGSWFVDFADLEQAVTAKTRAIIVVSPNNPTGSFLKHEEAKALAHFATARRMPLIVDEVFLDYGFGAVQNRLQSFAGVQDGLIFCLNGLSKSAGMPQMKLGWITVAGNSEETQPALRALELLLDTYLSVGTPAQIAVPQLLNIGRGIREQLRQRTTDNLNRLIKLLDNTPAHCLHAEGGWSAIIRLPGHVQEDEWIHRLLSQDVIVQPGYFFDMPAGSFAVVSLITRPDIFIEGLSRIRQVIS